MEGLTAQWDPTPVKLPTRVIAVKASKSPRVGRSTTCARVSPALTVLQVAAVDGFLQQMAMMGVAVDDPEETPRNIVYLALCAGYSMAVAGAMGDYVTALLKAEVSS